MLSVCLSVTIPVMSTQNCRSFKCEVTSVAPVSTSDVVHVKEMFSLHFPPCLLHCVNRTKK